MKVKQRDTKLIITSWAMLSKRIFISFLYSRNITSSSPWKDHKSEQLNSIQGFYMYPSIHPSWLGIEILPGCGNSKEINYLPFKIVRLIIFHLLDNNMQHSLQKWGYQRLKQLYFLPWQKKCIYGKIYLAKFWGPKNYFWGIIMYSHYLPLSLPFAVHLDL